jgi:putative SOS response-associated peptidase YedK
MGSSPRHQREAKTALRLHIKGWQSDHVRGLVGSWRLTEDADPIETCTIVTCGPNEIMEPFYDRLPVMLPRDLWEVWLDPEMEGRRIYSFHTRRTRCSSGHCRRRGTRQRGNSQYLARAFRKLAPPCWSRSSGWLDLPGISRNTLHSY